MNNTASRMRVFRAFVWVMLIALVVGCSGRRSFSTAPASDRYLEKNSDQAAISSTPQDARFSISKTETLSESSEGTAGIEYQGGEAFDRFVIRTGELPVGKHEVFRLEAPSRIVLDVAPQVSRLSRVFTIGSSPYVSRLRVGSHPQKSRFVFDLNQKQKESGLSYNLDVQNADIEGEAALVLTIAPSNDLAVALKNGALKNGALKNGAALENSASESVDVLAVNREQENRGFSSSEIQEASQAVTSEKQAEEEQIASVLEESVLKESALKERDQEKQISLSNNKKTESERPILQSAAIEPMGSNSNMLVLDMESAGFYTLEKTAPSEYVLTLEDATASDGVQTLVASKGTGDIRSVRPTTEGEDLLLRIFVNPTAELEANSRGSTIVVSTTDASQSSSIRAQFDESEVQESIEEKGAESVGNDSSIEEADAGPAKAPPAAPNTAEAEVAALFEDAPKYTGRLISLDLQDTDIDNALRIIAEVSNLNIIASDEVAGKVTLRLIDVPWDQALDVILKTNGLDKVQEGNVIRIAPVEKLRQEREALKQAQQAEEDLEPLQVRYIRVSYAKASELQPLVETVLTERGTVAYDERTNQLIIKDIARGVKHVAILVSKLDLRTPQVLLETQIVEATRSLLRDLGSEVGFEYIRSPQTGNATGDNFPNSITIGGAVTPDGTVGSSFPASVSEASGSAINFLLDSADGTRSLDARLTALESEGRARVVSRPSVATTNNTQALIKSVEKIRVKTPSGGLSVATGQGASAQGGTGIATEIIEVGIILEVTPQASPDYYVLLDINAKSSTLGTNEVEGIPSEVERSATSTVLVSSGQTFAMGGIYKITDRDSISGIPFLKDVPFLGHLFRRSRVDNADEELIFFITPRIIEGSFDDATMKASL